MGERKTFSYIQELKTLTIKEHVLKEWVKDVFQQKKKRKLEVRNGIQEVMVNKAKQKIRNSLNLSIYCKIACL